VGDAKEITVEVAVAARSHSRMLRGDDMENQRGVSLVELMIVLAMTSVLMAGIYSFVSIRVKPTSSSQCNRDSAQGRVAIERMTKEIRLAGFRRLTVSGDSRSHGDPFSLL